MDQFVDNVFPTEKPSAVYARTTPIRNILYINDRHGRESFHRMYQRTTFYTQDIGKTTLTGFP